MFTCNVSWCVTMKFSLHGRVFTKYEFVENVYLEIAVFYEMLCSIFCGYQFINGWMLKLLKDQANWSQNKILLAKSRLDFLWFKARQSLFL